MPLGETLLVPQLFRLVMWWGIAGSSQKLHQPTKRSFLPDLKVRGFRPKKFKMKLDGVPHPAASPPAAETKRTTSTPAGRIVVYAWTAASHANGV